MLRGIIAILKNSTMKRLSTSLCNTGSTSCKIFSEQIQYINTLAKQFFYQDNLQLKEIKYSDLSSIFMKKLLCSSMQLPPVPFRTVTKFSLKSGKRKTTKTVIKRFYRLNWGIWIRTIAGRHKRLWKKTKDRRIRAKQHVFTNATQSWMLDKMVTKFWKRPKFFVNDPYTAYHTREEFIFTKKKPACE